MQIKEFDSQHEKRVLAGMIMDSTVAGKIAAKWTTAEGLFRTRWANAVGNLVVSYYRSYSVAPKGCIEALFDDWAEGKDGAVVDLVDDFLAELSAEYEDYSADDLNVDYIVDTADKHFNQVALEKMADTIKVHLSNSDLASAESVVASWSKVELGMGRGVDLLQDEEAIERAFEARSEPLITYPGALGELFSDQLSRDEFVAITGATGTGKTWWLVDIACMGMKQNRQVAFFEVGDMSEAQIDMRFLVRMAQHPSKPPYTFEVPTAIKRMEDSKMASLETKTLSFNGPLCVNKAKEACKKKMRRHKRSLLRISTHSNTSININGIEGILADWEREGWVPDIIIIDYADDLTAPTGFVEGDREGINHTWKRMRGISQKRHCLLVTATQGDANSYNAYIMRRSNFSDDRRKNDHATGMMGISMTEEEKALGITRVNWTKRREEKFSESVCVHVAGCLSLGRPHIKSTF